MQWATYCISMHGKIQNRSVQNSKRLNVIRQLKQRTSFIISVRNTRFFSWFGFCRELYLCLEILLKTYSRSFLPSSSFQSQIFPPQALGLSNALRSGRIGNQKIMYMKEYDELLLKKEKIVMQIIQLNHLPALQEYQSEPTN